MKYYGKSEETARRILEAFQRGNLPESLATVFIKRRDGRPSSRWSWSNQLLCILAGGSDYRGFRQWEAVGRSVNKGEHSRCSILVPCTKKETLDDGTERVRVYGYKSQCVFSVDQTSGKPIDSGLDADTAEWFARLPLLDVCEAWNISVELFNGEGARYRGFYRHGAGNKAIALGVRNVVVLAHEVMHAADDRLGALTERGQVWSSELVAQLGASTLLICLGYELEADLGFCWRYIEGYARDAGLEPTTACLRILSRCCNAVALVLQTAEQLATDRAITLDGVTEEDYAAAASRVEVVD